MHTYIHAYVHDRDNAFLWVKRARKDPCLFVGPPPNSPRGWWWVGEKKTAGLRDVILVRYVQAIFYRTLNRHLEQASRTGIVGIFCWRERDRHEGFRATLRKRVSKAKRDLRCAAKLRVRVKYTHSIVRISPRHM